jgi:hypothetical protein
VSRLKLPSLAQLFKGSVEKKDPAHAGCYEKSEVVRSEKTCASEGESPSGPAAKPLEFGTKVKNGKT